MKIHLQTKRGLNTLKFGACSEILTLLHRGNGNPGNNVSYILRLCQRNCLQRWRKLEIPGIMSLFYYL